MPYGFNLYFILDSKSELEVTKQSRPQQNFIRHNPLIMLTKDLCQAAIKTSSLKSPQATFNQADMSEVSQ